MCPSCMEMLTVVIASPILEFASAGVGRADDVVDQVCADDFNWTRHPLKLSEFAKGMRSRSISRYTVGWMGWMGWSEEEELKHCSSCAWFLCPFGVVASSAASLLFGRCVSLGQSGPLLFSGVRSR